MERLRAAAQRALGLGDPRGAVTYLRRALAEPPGADGRADVLLELGRAEARAGDPEAIAHLERVMAEAPDARLAAQAALELAPVLKFAGEAVRAVAVTERALERLGDADPELAERLEIELFGSAYISIAARTLLAPRLAALGEPPQSPTTPFDRFRLAGIAFDAFAAGRPADEVADLATRALAHGALATDPTAGGHAFVSGAIALMFAERYDEADRLYSGALEDARRRGSGIAFATASSLRSLVAFRRGRLSEALADASAALELADEVHGSQGFLAAALGTLVYTALDQGTVDADLEAFAERFVREQAADSLPYSHAMHAHACLRVHRGELEPAYQELLATGRRELEWGARNPAVTPWRSTAALVAHELGDVRAARELAFEEVELARAFGAPRALGIALRAAGLVAEREQGIALLAEAVAVLDRSLGALEHARALIDHGLLLAAVGAEDLSRPRLTAGHALAIRCGAAALAGRARGEPGAGARGAGARRGADAVGGARGPDGRGGDDQPRHRPGAVRHAEDGRDAPRQRLPQAGRALAPGAPGGARLGLQGGRRGGDAQGAPRAVQELGDGVRVHAEPVTDLVVGEVAELAQHPGRALALRDGRERGVDGVAGGAVECRLLGQRAGLERLDVRAGLAQRVERGVGAPAAHQVEARVARGAEHVEAQALFVAAGVDASPGEVGERVLQGVGGVVLATEHAHAVAVHAVAVQRVQAGERVGVRGVGFHAVGHHRTRCSRRAAARS